MGDCPGLSGGPWVSPCKWEAQGEVTLRDEPCGEEQGADGQTDEQDVTLEGRRSKEHPPQSWEQVP